MRHNKTKHKKNKQNRKRKNTIKKRRRRRTFRKRGGAAAAYKRQKTVHFGLTKLEPLYRGIEDERVQLQNLNEIELSNLFDGYTFDDTPSKKVELEDYKNLLHPIIHARPPIDSVQDVYAKLKLLGNTLDKVDDSLYNNVHFENLYYITYCFIVKHFEHYEEVGKYTNKQYGFLQDSISNYTFKEDDPSIGHYLYSHIYLQLINDLKKLSDDDADERKNVYEALSCYLYYKM